MTPIHMHIRKELSIPDGKPMPKDKYVERRLGISLDAPYLNYSRKPLWKVDSAHPFG